MKKLFFIPIFVMNLFAVGTEEVLLADIVSNGVESIKKFNDQIKIATETMDNIDKVNKTLDSVENLVLNSGEKIYNPAKTLQRMLSKMEALNKRFQDFPNKFENSFGYDRFFKDYHSLNCKSEYTTIENKAFSELSQKTGITIEELKVRECIYDNLSKKQTEEQKLLLQDTLQNVMDGNYAQAQENIRKYNNITLSQTKTNNNDLIEAIKPLQDLYRDSNQKNDQNQTKLKTIRDQIGKITDELRSDNNKDIVSSIATTNELLISMLDILVDSYTAQINFYNSWSKLNTILYGSPKASEEEIQKLKDQQVAQTTNPYIENLKANAIMGVDELGIPVFKSRSK